MKNRWVDYVWSMHVCMDEWMDWWIHLSLSNLVFTEYICMVYIYYAYKYNKYVNIIAHRGFSYHI